MTLLAPKVPLSETDQRLADAYHDRILRFGQEQDRLAAEHHGRVRSNRYRLLLMIILPVAVILIPVLWAVVVYYCTYHNAN